MLRNSSLGFLVVYTLCATVFAQEPTSRGNGGVPQNTQSQPAAQGQQRGTPRIAPGSVIPVQLTKSIDAKKAKTGDAVEAKVTQDLKAESGEVIVPKDTKFVGHVTEAQPRTKEQKESQVGIAFDHAVMRNGGDVSMPLSIQAVISPSAANGGSNNPGNAPAGPYSSQPSSGGAAPGTGTRGGMNTGTPPSSPSAGAGVPTGSPTQAGGNMQEPITGKTQGVVGISNMKLTSGSQPAQGSILTSEKNNVKLESGTLMLLRVNP
jgi:hypothetical protein